MINQDGLTWRQRPAQRSFHELNRPQDLPPARRIITRRVLISEGSSADTTSGESTDAKPGAAAMAS